MPTDQALKEPITSLGVRARATVAWAIALLLGSDEAVDSRRLPRLLLGLGVDGLVTAGSSRTPVQAGIKRGDGW